MAFPSRRGDGDSHGARALLFERLFDDEPHVPAEPRPLRHYDEAGLRESIQRELERLLNTRRGPKPPHPAARGTVLAYGVPDRVVESASGVRDQERLVRDIEGAVQAFEPRLEEVVVTVAEVDPLAGSITVAIEGAVRLGRQRVSVHFPVVIGGADDDGEGAE